MVECAAVSVNAQAAKTVKVTKNEKISLKDTKVKSILVKIHLPK